MRLKYCSLGSGSSGNLYLISDGQTNIFVDLGIRCKYVKAFLDDLGMSFSDISGALITHSHKDHTVGLPTTIKKFAVPAYMTQTCVKDAESRNRANIDRTSVRYFESGETFRIGTFTVTAYKVQHDTPDCHSFIIKSDNGVSLALSTDLGSVPTSLQNAMKECDVVILESNYSLTMLPLSGYPLILQERINSDHGHLSNDQCAEVLKSLIDTKVRYAHLAHISKESNTQDIALKYAQRIVGDKFHVSAFPRTSKSEIFEID